MSRCGFARREVIQHALVVEACGGGGCPYRNCDKHDFEVVEGDWEREITLPSNKRSETELAVTAHRAAIEAKRFLEIARQARQSGASATARHAASYAADARRRSAQAFRQRRECRARIAEIEQRIAARHAPAGQVAA